MDVVVGDTDYQSFAILYLERARKLSVKLYGVSVRDPGLRAHSARRGGQGAQRHTHTLLALFC